MLQRASGKDRLTNLKLSYELSLTGPRITPTSQRFLSVLALLPNGLLHGDFAAVFPDHADAAAATLRKAGLAFDEAGRMRVLAPLREYLRRARPPIAEDLTRLVAHFIGLASNLADTVGQKGGAEAVRRLTPEAANIEAMITLSLAKDTPSTAISAAFAWGEFLRFTGVGSLHPLEQAANVARQHGDQRNEANCIGSLGDIALARSDHATATTRYEAALPLYRQVGDVLGEANCIRSLGDIALRRSDHATAQGQFTAALSLYKRIEEPYSIGMTHRCLAQLAKDASDEQECELHVQAARAAWERIDRPDLLEELENEFGKSSA